MEGNLNLMICTLADINSRKSKNLNITILFQGDKVLSMDSW